MLNKKIIQHALIIVVCILSCVTEKFANAESYWDSSRKEKPVIVKLLPIKYSQNEALFALVLEIPAPWKVYGNEPGDTGLPFSIKTISNDNANGIEIIWPATQVIYEDIGGQSVHTNVYSNKVVIPINVKTPNSPSLFNLELKVVFGACDKICIKQEEVVQSSINEGFVDAKLYSRLKDLLNVKEPSAFLMFVLAFFGGLILNIMPCVLPVLSLKVVSLINYSQKSSKQIRFNLLSTTLGVIFSYMILALLTVTLKNSGALIGWGFHFQHPEFIMFMIVILLIFALNLFEQFDFELPQVIRNMISNKVSNTQGVYESFLTGAFATLLATPCTVSFLTVSVAYALTQGGVAIFGIYLSAGLGMALPYMLLAAFPNALHALPKPGPWITYVKKVAAIMLVLTATWLYYILFSQVYFKTILIFFGALILLKFVLTNQFKHMPKWIRVILISLTLICTVLLPYWMDYSEKYDQKRNNLLWLPFTQELLDSNIAAGNLIFVDVTADWCLTCGFNKFIVLDHHDELLHLKSHGAILIRADYTNSNEEIAKYLQKNKHFGLPFNIVYGPRAKYGIVLPTILSKEEISDAIKLAK